MLLITKPQQYRFFREWSGIVSANGWPHDQAETERHALLKRAGFNSLTEVTPVAGFTAVLKELAAMQENLAGMIRADANPRRMMVWNIHKKSPAGYWQSIARDRFGTLLALGVTVLFAVHVFVNIAMTIGLVPITGIPLPFISYGGSFVLSCCVLQGLVQSVYRFRKEF